MKLPFIITKHIYILIALEHGEVKEDFAVSSLDDALMYRNVLQEIYGAGNVVMASRMVDDVPMVVQIYGRK